MADSNQDLTEFSRAVRDGDSAAIDRILPAVYAELRRLAAKYLDHERADHTLQTTALVHEAYLNLADQRVEWRNRAHFLAIAAIAMRRLLMRHARDRATAKRGGGRIRIEWDDSIALFEERATDLLALDDSMNELAKIDPRAARIIEMRFYGGLTNREVAEVLDLSERTVEREWRSARAWLRKELRDPQDES